MTARCAHVLCPDDATAVIVNQDLMLDGDGTCDRHAPWFAEFGYDVRPFETCSGCGTTIVEHPDEGNGPWWGQPRINDFDPCEDENGYPARHGPE